MQNVKQEMEKQSEGLGSTKSLTRAQEGNKPLPVRVFPNKIKFTSTWEATMLIPPCPKLILGRRHHTINNGDIGQIYHAQHG